jgi:pimeloyl-ACP methyl ester carboxylesterase
LSEAGETRAVAFHSDGSKLAATLYLPVPAHGGGRGAPAVVVAAGWGGTKDRGLVQFATRFATAGFAALAFDYRGYGESEGAKNRLFPIEQSADIRAAVAFLRQQDGIDPGRVSVLGVLTSGAAALQAASEDPGISAVVGFFPFGNGETWMQAQRRNGGWSEFVRRIEEDRVHRAVDGTTKMVDPNEILIRDPEGIEREERSRAGSPARRAWRLGLDSADAILSFKPEDHLHRISPRPVMIVAVRNDTLMPYAEVERLFTKLEEPKRLLTLDGIRHHDIYEPTRLNEVINEVVDFLGQAPA